MREMLGAHRVEQMKQSIIQEYNTGINKMAADQKQTDADNENQIAEKSEQLDQMANEMLKSQRRYELAGGATGLVGGLGLGTVIGNRTGYGAAGALGGLFGIPVGNVVGNKLHDLRHKGDIHEYNRQVDELNNLLDKQEYTD